MGGKDLDKIILVFCSLVSCIISVNILFQFMNERYTKVSGNKWLYKFLPTGCILFITGVNALMIPLLNMAVHVLLFGATACFIYSGGRGRKINRVVEVETLYVIMASAEAMGMFLLDFLLKIMGRVPDNLEILKSMETAFSKMVVLFFYYVLFSKLWKNTELRTRSQYMLYFIMFIYGTVNILLISYISEKENPVILIVAVGSTIFCNMYMLYFIQFSDERNSYKLQVEMMEQQEKLQYGNYKAQVEKYSDAMSIIHDVDKYVKQMENLYKEKLLEESIVYADQISDKLKGLLPRKYSSNPILNCLLSEKEKEAEKFGVRFQVKNFTGDVNFMKPIDITTLFGNIIDNAISAASECTKGKFVENSLNVFNEMVSIRVENTVNQKIAIKKGEIRNKGIGILNIERCVETYMGSIIYSCRSDIICCDIILNRPEK